MPGVPWVVLGQNVGRDTLQHLLGEDSKQLPANVERLENSAILITSLSDEVLLKLGQELQIQEIIWGQGLLSHDSLHGLDILTNSITSIKLVGDIGVILASHSLTNGRLHKTGKRGEHIDGRVDLPVVNLTINKDLALCDVA